jgi:AbrB family looped-hinge helix DNA binding protein
VTNSFRCRVDKDGRVTIPSQIRRELGWERGDVLLLTPGLHGQIVLEKVASAWPRATTRASGSRLG